MGKGQVAELMISVVGVILRWEQIVGSDLQCWVLPIIPLANCQILATGWFSILWGETEGIP